MRARPQREVVETTISTEEARHIAGTEGDALKVVQSLPGVARAAFGQGQLVVWGAAPADTRIYVDDVEIPQLYHLGGFRSTVNDGLVRSIDFVPGGQGAAWGRGLGGLVRLETRAPIGEGVHGYIGADVLDASALLEAALTKRLSVVVAGRYSYLDKVLSGLPSRATSAITCRFRAGTTISSRRRSSCASTSSSRSRFSAPMIGSIARCRRAIRYKCGATAKSSRSTARRCAIRSPPPTRPSTPPRSLASTTI